MTTDKSFETFDIYISAFLQLSGVSPNLQTKNNRVVFVFPAVDDVYKVMSNFTSNVNVPVADFVTAIKTLRGRMLSMRDAR